MTYINPAVVKKLVDPLRVAPGTKIAQGMLEVLAAAVGRL